MIATAEIVRRINTVFPLKPAKANYSGEVASRYQYLDGSGEIGFISSVTQPFCKTCSRLRLSTDGKIYTCLFASQGTDLRTPLRNNASDEELLSLMTCVWKKREDRYSEKRLRRSSSTENSVRKVEMFQIGG